MAARLHLTLSLEPAELRQLEDLAEAERCTPAAYVEALVSHHLAMLELRPGERPRLFAEVED